MTPHTNRSPLASRGTILAAGGALIVAGAAAFLGGCAAGPKAVKPTSESVTVEFDVLKSLQGEWLMTDENGKQVVASVFTVSSGGTAVREVMFPGSPHEMTNMYHLDGDSIVLTHFCAMGNQPRMRCTAPAKGVFVFRGFDCTNLVSADTEYMSDMTLSIADPTHIRQAWSATKGGQKSEHAMFELTRKTS